MIRFLHRRRLNTIIVDLHSKFGRLKLYDERRRTYLIDNQQAQ